MKKALLITGLVLAGLVVLVLVAAGIFLLSARDSTDHTPQSIRDENLTLEELIHKSAVDALDPAPDDLELVVAIDDVTLNRYLFAILPNLKGLGVLSFRGAYASFTEDGSLHIELPTRVWGVSTCLYATAKIEDIDGTLSVRLGSAKIGRFDCTSFWIRTFILTDGLGRKLEKSLAEMGLTVQIDMSDLFITTTHGSIAEMISSLTRDDPNAALYEVLSRLCLSTPELLEFRTPGNRFEVVLHTAEMTYDATRDGPFRYPLDMDAVRTKVEANRALDLQTVTVLYNLYTKGYSALSDEEKAVADSCGASRLERGVRTASGLSIAESLLKQKPNASLAELVLKQSYSVRIEDQTVDAILANLPFAGSCVAFADGSRTAFICVEGMTAQISENALTLGLCLNLNGRRISLTVEGSCPPGTGESLEVTVTRIRFGSVALDGDYITGVLSYLSGVLATETWIEPKPETGSILLSVSEILDGTGAYDLVRQQCARSQFALKESTLVLTYYFLK